MENNIKIGIKGVLSDSYRADLKGLAKNGNEDIGFLLTIFEAAEREVEEKLIAKLNNDSDRIINLYRTRFDRYVKAMSIQDAKIEELKRETERLKTTFPEFIYKSGEDLKTGVYGDEIITDEWNNWVNNLLNT